MTATTVEMVPVLVTAPASPLVHLSAIKDHLRVSDTDSDTTLAFYESAAVGYLDGWSGALGRCIKEQQWSVAYDAAGTFRLPFSDVSGVAAVDADDAAVTATLSQDAMGSVVEIDAAATVTMTVAMPVAQVETVKMIVMLMVERMHDRPSGPAEAANAAATQMLIHSVRRAMV